MIPVCGRCNLGALVWGEGLFDTAFIIVFWSAKCIYSFFKLLCFTKLETRSRQHEVLAPAPLPPMSGHRQHGVMLPAAQSFSYQNVAILVHNRRVSSMPGGTANVDDEARAKEPKAGDRQR